MMKLEKCLRKILVETEVFDINSIRLKPMEKKNCRYNCLGINMKDSCPDYLSQDQLKDLLEGNYLI